MKKSDMKLIGITLGVTCVVVWASNNVDFVKTELGS